MAKFDPFLSLVCARVEGFGGTGWRAWGRNPRKGRDQILPSGNTGPGAAGVGRQGLRADFADLRLERGHPRAEEEELCPEVAPERRVAVRVLPAGQALVHLESWNSS